MRLPLDTRLALSQLSSELTAAGVPHTGLGTYEEPDALVLHTYDSGGVPADLPSEAEPVVDNHVAPPLVTEHVEDRQVHTVTRTTDGTMQELYRVPCSVKHVYDGAFVMRAVDAGTGAVKVNRVELTFKRGTQAAVSQVGSLSVIAARADAGTTAWTIAAQVQGTDLVIGVRGEAGHALDWDFSGVLSVFAPEGLS